MERFPLITILKTFLFSFSFYFIFFPFRPNFEEVANYLKSLGADYVLSESDIRKPEIQNIFKQLGNPKLALNGVGGKSATNLARHLR